MVLSSTDERRRACTRQKQEHKKRLKKESREPAQYGPSSRDEGADAPFGSASEHGEMAHRLRNQSIGSSRLLTPVASEPQLSVQDAAPPLPPRPAMMEAVHRPPPPTQQYNTSLQQLVPQASQESQSQRREPHRTTPRYMASTPVLPLQTDDGWSNNGNEYQWRRQSENSAQVAEVQDPALLDDISERMDFALAQNIDEGPCGPNLFQDQAVVSSRSPREIRRPQETAVATSRQPNQGYFCKAWLYANSRLPPSLPPLKLYIPTFPILCLAAQYSLRVYETSPSPPNTQPQPQPAISSRPPTIRIPASPRHNTKAITLSLHTCDTTRLILIAIRGTQSLRDWRSNLRSSPMSPGGFLSDPGNLCHAGFLAAARALLRPIAAELRDLLQQRPERCGASLCFTGHSAGGAVACLLYAYVMGSSDSGASAIASELKDIAAIFKRIHCVSFGAPPVSLLPLQRPSVPAHSPSDSRERKRIEKSLFFSFVNEGDPVVRADGVSAVKNLVALYTALPPLRAGVVEWPVPECTLSCAGRLVLLRGQSSLQLQTNVTSTHNTQVGGVGDGSGALGTALNKFGLPVKRGKNGGGQNAAANSIPQLANTACVITDEQLRGVVFGDPDCHAMTLYEERVRQLATGAVIGNG
ncbi:MAG: hypothetical protein M1831_002206 [Alyxoria varia]|nr:MAG: hypothetical protein M1831_002206 [Alyxoria varia]